MATNRQALERLLLKHCADHRLAMNTMAGLQPYFDIAGSRRFRLEAGGEALARRAAGALGALLDRPVGQVRLVSRSRPFRRPPGMDDAEYQAAANTRLWSGVTAVIGAKTGDVFDRLETEIAAGFDPGLWSEIWQTLDSALWFEFWDAARWGLEVGTENAVSSGLWKSLHGALLCHLGASLQAGPVSPARLRPLIALLPAALPLGALNGGSGDWLALCA